MIAQGSTGNKRRFVVASAIAPDSRDVEIFDYQIKDGIFKGVGACRSDLPVAITYGTDNHQIVDFHRGSKERIATAIELP